MGSHWDEVARLFFMLSLLLVLPESRAQEICKADRPIQTTWGMMATTACKDSQRHLLRKFISINGNKLLEDQNLFEEESSKSLAIWVFTGKALTETGCPDRLYLIDISMTPAKVFAFGVKRACNEFHWASWGDKRSVIALKHNVKFVYENGKLTPPVSGEGLWKAIEPPHAGTGLAKEDAVAFVEEVSLPKAP